jgi:hypothetical protein
MQLREGSFHGSRPSCPRHPDQWVHRHGFYERFEDCDSQRRSRIERFVCPRCGRTLSVLPKNRLPYIAVNTTILESDFDTRASGTDPPPMERLNSQAGVQPRSYRVFWMAIQLGSEPPAAVICGVDPLENSAFHSKCEFRPWSRNRLRVAATAACTSHLGTRFYRTS